MSEDRLLRCSLFRSFPFWPWLRSRPDEEVTGKALEQSASGVSAWCHPFGETRGYKMGVKENS
jgi:hypothetical protein